MILKLFKMLLEMLLEIFKNKNRWEEFLTNFTTFS